MSHHLPATRWRLCDSNGLGQPSRKKGRDERKKLEAIHEGDVVLTRPKGRPAVQHSLFSFLSFFKLFFHFLFLSFSSCNTEEDDNNQLKPFEWNYSLICFFILLLSFTSPLSKASTGSLIFLDLFPERRLMLSYCFRRDRSYQLWQDFISPSLAHPLKQERGKKNCNASTHYLRLRPSSKGASWRPLAIPAVIIITI